MTSDQEPPELPYELRQGARNCVRFGNPSPGDLAMVLAEPTSDEHVVGALAEALREIGATVHVLVKEPTPLGEPLSAVVGAALRAADLVFDLGYPTVHSEDGFYASFDYGTKNLIVRPEAVALMSEAARYPIELFYEMGRRTQAQLREERTVHVTSESGTDFRMSVEPGAVGAWIGERPYEPGPAVPGYIGTFPPGTTVWGDLNYSGNGPLVFDAAYAYPEPVKPIRWEIADGWVVDVSGGPEADDIGAIIKRYENGNRFAECGFGLNPKVQLNPGRLATVAARSGAVLSWTRKAGTFFGGVGGNTLMGGTDRSSVVPIYGVVLRPTVRIGGRTMVDDGLLLPIADADAELLALAASFGDPDVVLGEVQS